ncbi:MAG: T9SS type A sorting domain-containing protein [Bacteroidetes bacterium]|nr:T9SS type A sorting domain-containing protein [Bacteroidota bacterium]
MWHIIHRILLLKIILLATSVLSSSFTFSQIPTDQDCLGAIAVCQATYYTEISYSGTGNYLNEINPGPSCMDWGELNDVWYIITVKTGGNLGFLITPNQLSDDYDWTVFELTNAECSDIYYDPSLEVSCNWSGTPGATGANGGSNYTTQGAGGTPFNALIPVSPGEIYVLNISNFSQSQSGYFLDFGLSTASIYDDVHPYINYEQQTIGCAGDTELYIEFSENVVCTTVQPADFSLTGPSGEVFTVTDVTGEGCEVGGEQEKAYTLTVTPPIFNSGQYIITVIGVITDLCENNALSSPVTFELQSGLPVVDFDGLHPFWCENEQPDTIYGNHYPETGNSSFTGPGITDLGNNSAVFNPGATGPGGPYSVTYEYTDAGGCSNSISRLVTVQSLPIQYTVGGGGSYCEGSTGPEIYLVEDQSEAFVGYELYHNGSSTGQIVMGTGIGGINFGLQTEAGVYTVKASGNCGNNDMLGSAEIDIAIVPQVFNVSGGGYYCENVNGTSITLNDSEAGVTYELLLNSLPTGIDLEGTGDPVSFNGVTMPGWYTVLAFNTICSDTMAGAGEIGINPVPVANAGPDKSIPYGTWTTLDGSATGGTSGYTWHWEPANLLVNPDIEDPQTINLDITTIFTLKVTDINGCEDTDDIIVTVVGGPLGVNVSADNDQLCLGESTQLHALASGGAGVYTYSWVSNPPGFTSTDANPVVTPAMNTLYTVTVNDGYNSSQGSTSLTVKPLPGAQASADLISIPYGSWTTLHAVTTGGIGPFSYQWSPADKVVNSSSADPETVHLEYTVVFTVLVTDQSTGCHDEASVTVEVYGGPLQIVSVTADPDAMCNTGGAVQLSGVVAGGTENYTYQWTSNPPGFNASILNTVAYPTQSTTYTLAVNDGNVTVNGSVDVTVHALPSASAGEDKTIPYGTWTVLSGYATGGSGFYFWNWEPVDMLVNSFIQNPQTINMTESTIFTLKATDQYGCWDEDQITINVVGGPLGVNAYAESPEICQGVETMLQALAFGGAETYQYTWKDNTGSVISNNVSMYVNPDTTTVYTIEVSDGYNESSNTVTVTVNPLPAINLIPQGSTIIGEDTIAVCVYDTLILDAGNPGFQYEWSDLSWGQTLQVRTTGIGLVIQTYWVIVSNPETGCHASDSLTVLFSFSECTGIPTTDHSIDIKIFPNPTHDQIHVIIKGLTSTAEMEIFDMHGQIILRKNIRSNGADGYTGQLDLSFFHKGIYMFKLISDNVVYLKKIILE